MKRFDNTIRNIQQHLLEFLRVTEWSDPDKGALVLKDECLSKSSNFHFIYSVIFTVSRDQVILSSGTCHTLAPFEYHQYTQSAQDSKYIKFAKSEELENVFDSLQDFFQTPGVEAFFLPHNNSSLKSRFIDKIQTYIKNFVQSEVVRENDIDVSYQLLTSQSSQVQSLIFEVHIVKPSKLSRAKNFTQGDLDDISDW